MQPNARATLATGAAFAYVIHGVPRSGKNSMRLLRNRKTGKPFAKKSKCATAWLDAARTQLVIQHAMRKTISTPVRVDAVYYQPSDRVDGDNMEALLWDALKLDVLTDDSIIVAWSGEKRIDKARPRIEVTITPEAARGEA